MTEEDTVQNSRAEAPSQAGDDLPDVDDAPFIPLSGGSVEWPVSVPPVIEARPTCRIVHETALADDFAWLRADNWRQVLRDPSQLPPSIRAVLDAENAYSAAHLDSCAEFVDTLVAEMRGRIEEDASTVPLEDGPWLYYRRFRKGGQRPIACRKLGADGAEQILVDGDLESEGHDFFAFCAAVHAPNHRRIAWSADRKGSELYEIRLRDCATGVDLLDKIVDTNGAIVWLSDSSGFYYVRIKNHRSCQVWRHILDSSDDVLVFEESDTAWFVDIDRTSSEAFAVITVTDHDATECHFLDLADPTAAPRCIEPRTRNLRYSPVHRHDELFILTNADGAEDFKIVSTPAAAPGRANWTDVVEHRRGRLIVGQSVFSGHLVRLEREEGLPRIVARDLSDGDEHAIAFDEDAYALDLHPRLIFDADLRFSYSSMTKPRETFDYDLVTRERRLRQRKTIPSGHDPTAYATRRLFATASDGERVPITLLHRAGFSLDGQAPLLLHGYGSYGAASPASFSSNVLSLVDRGFVYAIAHVRGGTDKGWHWYTDGKLDKKTNTFTDFIAVARTLVAEGYASKGRVVTQGRSAGGMLMGAIANMAPDLFAGIIAVVPFVDVLNTILDGELPLTPPEWLEWGNPITDRAAFEWIRSYSPYDNVVAQSYPPILVFAGLTDPRVTYWEPAKWVAQLRAKMTGGGPILLKTNMGAGHAGASGRFDRLRETAEQYAFAIRCVEVSPRCAP